MARKSVLIGCAVILIGFYISIFYFDLDLTSELAALVSSVVAITAALFWGKFTGLIIGTIAGGAYLFYLMEFTSHDIFSLSGAGIGLPVLSGLFFGYLSDVNRKKQKKLKDILDEQKAKEKELEKKLNDYAELEEKILERPVYMKDSSHLLLSGSEAQRVLSVCADICKNDDIIVDKSFELLIGEDPDILAIADLKGNITGVNKMLLSLFGNFSTDKPSHILDLITDHDRDTAQADIRSVLTSGLLGSKRYGIQSNEDFRLFDPGAYSITLSTGGNPRSILARISFDQDMAASFPEIGSLRGKNIWFVSRSGDTLYMNDDMRDLLRSRSPDIPDQSITALLDDNEKEKFQRLFRDPPEIGRVYNMELSTGQGKKLFINVRAWTAFDKENRSSGMFMLIEPGMFLSTENTSDLKQLEISIQKQLVLEKNIAVISSMFINKGKDSFEKIINEALFLAVKFLGANEGHLVLYESEDTGSEFKKSIWGKPHHTDPITSDLSISVPIMSKTSVAGYFRFAKSASSKIWSEEDISFAKRLGEIFLNAKITEKKLTEAVSKDKKIETTIGSMSDGVILTDEKEIITYINPEAERLTGFSLRDSKGKHISEIMKFSKGSINEAQKNHISLFDNNKPVLISRHGEEYILSADVSSIRDENDSIYGKIFVFRDITEDKKREEELIHLSLHDKLTGLHNRAFFEAELKRLDTKRQYPLTLILGDCNGLKITNAIFGHQEGDRLLTTVAGIFKKVTREEDIITRWGGDEFVIILPRTPEARAYEIRQMILDECKVTRSSSIQPTIALGIASKTDQETNIRDVLKKAEERMYEHKLKENKNTFQSILRSIEKKLGEKSLETEEHMEFMKELSTRVARAIDLSDGETEELLKLAALHDLGVLDIPGEVLKKPDKLTNEEWNLIKTHPEKGFSMAKSTNELSGIAKYILHHHEHWNGSGYPNGLSGNQIPELSRIISIIDAYSVITHPRPYKRALPPQEAAQEIERCSGTQFDPDLVKVFLNVLNENKRRRVIY
jgi:diguanylate cyclase (GGDEF)-like protein/PAS domain S-box-containing protein